MLQLIFPTALSGAVSVLLLQISFVVVILVQLLEGTMNEIQLFTQISSLPIELKKEVSDFVEFLKTKNETNVIKKERVFGYAKGFFTMKDNFDDPIEDFKEYMK